MQRSLGFLYVAAGVTMLVAGCGGDGAPSTAESTSESMPEMQQASGAEHTAVGTVNAVDAAAGTVNLSHDPVPSADWPAMTMNFRLADSVAAADLTPGEKVRFRFTIEGGMSATVTSISPAD